MLSHLTFLGFDLFDRTLVDILAGKRKVGKTLGTVQLLTENARAVRIGYVDQADVLPANLSAYSERSKRKAPFAALTLTLLPSTLAYCSRQRMPLVCSQAKST